ncbi:MAG TPA: LytTR family DNA-binding domain-containing protein [Chondromyces sp.]|nr:LytTR family DNA-binding domain-containing protein [Chondromyces sp.]
MEQIIKVLIVDDERYSREELQHLLKDYSGFQVIGEADSGESAVMQALQLQPDVIFLDIEMPKMNGMEVAKALKELKRPPLLVFATAYPNFAAEAFRYEAVDYLLKPYDEEQLKETIERIKRQLLSVQQTVMPAPTGKLAVEGEEEIIYLDPKDILYISREGKLSKIITRTNEYETKISLKVLEARLAKYAFFRVHKSYIVNLDHVKRLIPWFHGAFQLEIEGREEKLSVSRNYVKELRSRLEL